MIDGFVKEALENARGWVIGQFTDAAHLIFAPFFDPLNQLYAMGVATLLAFFVVGWFFPFKWVRAALGFILLLVAAYIAGARQMYGTMNEKLRQERAKRRR